MKKQAAAGKELSFESTLENWAEGMDYSAVSVPTTITEALGTHAAVAVMASVNDCEPFSVSVFPVGGGRHYIRIRSAVRKAIGAATGDRVRVRITVVDRADVAYPADLTAALKAAGVTEAFKALSPGKQNFIIRRIDEAAKSETRAKRIAEAVTDVKKKP